MVDGDGFCLVDCGTGEGIVGQAIDLAGHTLGGLEQGLYSGRLE